MLGLLAFRTTKASFSVFFGQFFQYEICNNFLLFFLYQVVFMFVVALAGGFMDRAYAESGDYCIFIFLSIY